MAGAATNLGDRIGSWDDLFALRDREVHVVGAGSVEGAHLLLFLADHGFKRLVGHDFSTPETFPRAFKRVHVGWPMADRERMLEKLLESVRMVFRDRYLEGVDGADAIAVTQGWYLYESNRPLAQSPGLQQRFFSLVQLYLGLSPGPVVGVSGSQGKSTTTRLLRDMLVADGRDVIFAGNDRHGQQALDRLQTATPDTHLVLEISNRHLKMLHRSPRVAVLTNIYPNHLEEHGGWDGYVDAKAGLVRYQQEGDVAVLNGDLDVTRGLAALTPAATYWFGETLKSAADEPVRARPGVVAGDETVNAAGPWPDASARSWSIEVAGIPVAGRHNALNVAAAACAALAMGVAPPAVTGAIRDFRGLKHRIQFIWLSDGVSYYDDLNSTTPTASEVALRTLGQDVVWILGGEDKGLDSTSLARTAQGRVRRALALPGGGTEAIVANLLAEGVEVERVADFGAAVRRAVEVARDGDSVLLSPACPGFFTLYYVGADEDSGFKKQVREATLPTSPPPTFPPPTFPLARRPRT
ncbi:MAG TPA: UDP-N-acetylmuramoyl-L-alanine--D-glutamate ligase [Candidatus Dormibacteraeota bacterium]|jgi:UDP-N-acetylmuramoylalanine--D-glutamate ligase